MQTYYFSESSEAKYLAITNKLENLSFPDADEYAFLRKFLSSHKITTITINDDKIELSFDNGDYLITYTNVETDKFCEIFVMYSSDIRIDLSIPLSGFKYYNHGELIRDNGFIKVG